MKALLISLFLFICVLLFFLYRSNLPSSPGVSAISETANIDSRSAWLVIQEWRSSSGLAQYNESELLCRYANFRVEQIQADFSHKQYRNSVAQALYKEDSSLVESGENLSRAIFTPKQLLSSWLESPSHRENLEKPFTDSCIRCNNNYCVQLFAR